MKFLQGEYGKPKNPRRKLLDFGYFNWSVTSFESNIPRW